MLAQLTALAIVGAISVRAQNQTASAYDINVVEANFQNAQLTPQFLPEFEPQGTLSVSFGGQAIQIGQNLSQSAVTSSPELTVLPADGATRINTNSAYTIAMIDADIVGTAGNTPMTRHWLVNTVGLSGNPPYAVNYTGATTITDYAGPGPAAGSGPHRYVIMVYAQSSSFSPPSNLSTAGTPLGTMVWSSYIAETGLGPLIAANYMIVENGQATVSVTPTSAVNTATIASTTASSSASGASVSGASSIAASASASHSASGSATGSASGSASSAASSSHGAAGKVQPVNLGVGVIIGAVGLVGTLFGASLGF